MKEVFSCTVTCYPSLLCVQGVPLKLIILEKEELILQGVVLFAQYLNFDPVHLVKVFDADWYMAPDQWLFTR